MRLNNVKFHRRVCEALKTLSKTLWLSPGADDWSEEEEEEGEQGRVETRGDGVGAMLGMHPKR